MRFKRHALQRKLWVVLPFRGIDQGKSRLAGALSAAERAQFNRWLLLHTLRVVASWQGGLSRCIVVSPCARALHIARDMQANALLEPVPHNDLNRALAFATRAARRCGARRVLILACDLPWLTKQALDTLLERAAGGAQWVLATDTDGSGTNGMILNPHARLSYRYGAQSRTHHVNVARANGYSVTLVKHPAFARDVDTPKDLAAWRNDECARRAG